MEAINFYFGFDFEYQVHNVNRMAARPVRQFCVSGRAACFFSKIVFQKEKMLCEDGKTLFFL